MAHAGEQPTTRWVLRRAIPHQPDHVTATLLDRVMKLLRKPGAATAWRNWERREVGWHGLRTSHLDRLPMLAVSTLILHGADDSLLPVAVAERACRLIRNSRLEVIPACGHLAPFDQPAAVTRALSEFLLAA
jgi:2-hydroxy-6-oxonona-2,4-dienedioate hydrolase